MASEEDDLLLRVQSDVASAVADLHSMKDSLDGVKKSSDSAAGAVGGIGAQAVVANQSLELFKKVASATVDVLKTLREITLGQAEAFGKYAQQLDNSTKQLGVSAKFYQELEVRLTKLGLGAASATTSLTFFGRALEQAREGAGEAAKWIQRLNVDVDRSRNLSDVYTDVGIAITKLNDQGQKAAATMAFFGRQGSAQLPLFEELAAGADNAADSFEQLGYILGGEVLEKGLQFDKAIGNLGSTVEAFGKLSQSVFAEILTPAVKAANDALRPVAEWMIAHRETIATTAKVVTALAVGFGAVATAVAGGFGVTVAFWALVEVIPALIGLVGELAVAVGLATGGLTIIAGLLASGVTYWMLYGESAEEAGKKVEGSAKKNEEAVQGFVEAVRKGDAELRLSPLGAWLLGTGVSAHNAHHEYTKEQQKMVDDARTSLNQAVNDAKVAEIERTKGKRAAIAERAKLDKEELEAETKRKIEATDNEDEKRALRQAQALREEEIDAKAAADRQAIAVESNNKLTEIEINAAADRAKRKLDAEKNSISSLEALHQIQHSEALQRLQVVADQEIAIEIERQRKLLSIAGAEVAEREAIEKKIEALQDQRANSAELSAQKIQVALQSEAEEYKSLAQQVEQYTEQAFGSETQKQLGALARAHEQLVESIRKSGHLELIDEVNAAYQRMAADAKGAVIDLNSAVKTGIEDAFSGIISGTRKMGDVFKAFRESMVKQFTQGFAEALQKKLGFDAKFKINVTEDLPNFMAEGAAKIGENLSSVLNLFGGDGSGRASNITVNDGLATGTGGIFSQASVGANGRAVGYDAYGSKFSAPAQGAANSGSSQTTQAAAGAAGGIGAAGYAAIIAAGIGAIVGGLTAASDERKRFGATDNSVRGAAAAGAVSGSLDAIGLGALGKPLGKGIDKLYGSKVGRGVVNSTLMSPLLSGGVPIDFILPGMSLFVPDIFDAMGLFQARTVEDQYGKQFDKMWNKSGVPKIGKFRDNVLNRELPTLERKSSGSKVIQKVLQGSEAPEEYRDTFEQIGNLLYGKKKSAGRFFGNTMTNTFRGLGLDEEYTKKYAKQLLSSAGLDVTSGLEKINKDLLEGKITAEDFKKEAEAILTVFSSDLPRGMDVTTAAMESMHDISGKSIIDMEDFAKAVQRYVDLSEMFRSGIGSALSVYLNKSAYTPAEQADIDASEALGLRQLAEARQREIDQNNEAVRAFMVEQAVRGRNIELLEQQIATQKALGDITGATSLDMQRQQLIQERQAASAQEQTRKTQRETALKDQADEKSRADAATARENDPKYQLLKSIRNSIRSTVATALTSSLVDQGIAQVALAPFLKAIEDQKTILGDPKSTPDQVNAAIGAIGAAADVGVSNLGPAVDRILNILAMPNLNRILNINIPGLATGGIVTKPTLAMIGEAGPEAVVPLSRGGHSFGGITININVPSGMSSYDGHQFGRTAADGLLDRLKQHQLLG